MADLDDLLAAADRRPVVRAPTVARRLFRLVDGGAYPTSAGRFFLGLPVDADFAEAEGAGATFVAAPDAQPEPLLVIGSRRPDPGEVFVAVGVAGRWVADAGKPPTTVPCGGCAVPRADLTLSWTNSLLGPRTTTLVYDGVAAWTSACINQLAFRLDCASGSPTFSATYFVGGPCPSGSPNSCTSPGSSPLGLTLTLASCTPFLRRYSVTSCPALASQGYTTFTITE